MASLGVLRQALADQLDELEGVTAYAYAPGNVVTPCIIVQPGPITYDETFARGTDSFAFRLLLLVARTPGDDVAAEQLEPFLAGAGAKSIKAAVEADGGDLGGACHWVRVTTAMPADSIRWNDISYLGAEFAVELDADGLSGDPEPDDDEPGNGDNGEGGDGG